MQGNGNIKIGLETLYYLTVTEFQIQNTDILEIPVEVFT